MAFALSNVLWLCTTIYLLVSYSLAVKPQASEKFSEASNSRCRCVASHKCWPNQQAWELFNRTIDGRLIFVRPPAAPCHTTELDPEACKRARDKWNNPFWRSHQPGAMQAPNWETSGDERCVINSTASGCSQGAVSPLAVSALNPSHVQSTVRFAYKHNLRLVIKTTGHSYQGSSGAPGSLCLWLHNMKAMKFHGRFTPEGCQLGGGDSSAVTVGAGVQWEEVYLAAAERNFVVAGGACSSVGAAGGHPQAGGHSALSPLFGLVADNILQYQVVTADGQLLVANKCQNMELFWALRGGGGGTFGVVVSATHRVHPPLKGLAFASYNFTAGNNSSFEGLVTKFLEMTPGLSDAGWSGYFRIVRRSLLMNYILPDSNSSFASSTIAPLMAYIREQAGLEAGGLGIVSFPSFEHWRLQALCGGQRSCYNATADSYGGSGKAVVLASRLIPRETLANASTAVSSALLKVARAYWVFGNFVAGGRVSQLQDNSVNPAWRRALLHIILGRSLEEAPLAEQDAIAAALTQANRSLRDLTPGSGAYMSEADFNEPDWQDSLFGEHYPRLYAIKQRVDPSGLFVCHHCVGSEGWSEDLNCRRE